MDLEILEVKRLRGKFKLNLPENIRELVSFEHPVYGESVQWHIDTKSKVAVLSRSFKQTDESRGHDLDGGDFIPLDRVNVSSGSTVVLISEVRSSVEWEATVSGQVAYLAHSDMLEDERKSVYLVGGEIARKLIEQGISARPDYQSVLSKTPE